MDGATPIGDIEGVNWTSGAVVDSAYEVYRELGPGLLERTYRECLRLELLNRGHGVKAEVPVEVAYKGTEVGVGLRLDLVVDDVVVVEVKSQSKLLFVHQAQLLTYLRLTGLRVGLLINFNAYPLKGGIKRMVL